MQQPSYPRFHLAFVADDLTAARAFYVDVLGCGVGRTDDKWIDFDFFGHQVTLHLGPPKGTAVENAVDGDAVPVPHFGVILDMPRFDALAQKLRDASVVFIIEPRVRFRGRAGEQATMFFRDPAGNAIEIKAFADERRIFARED